MEEKIIVGDENYLKITDILSQHDIFYTKWSDVFTRLNVPFKTREPNRVALLNKTTTPESVYYECLQIWRSRESTKATVGTLISALVQCDLTAIADELRDKFIVSEGGEEEGGPAKKRRIDTTSNVIIGFEECKIIATDFLKDDKGFESRWMDIFRNLDVSTDIIDHKVVEFEEKDGKFKLEDVYTTCLENWRSTEGERATAGKLISVLHRFQLTELADELQDEYDVPLEDINRPDEPLSPSATWTSLDREKKKLLVGRDVTFQKRVTNMRTIFKELGHSIKSLNAFMEKYLDEKLLADVYYDRNPIIVRDTLPVKIKYYIERLFLSRRAIAEDVFKDERDIFLVSKVERHLLSKLAGRELTDTASQQSEQNPLTVRYILLELKSDFDDICEKTEKNVHWVEHHDGVYNWRRSRGNMKVIQSNIAPEQNKIEENEFLIHLETGSKAPICISDSPGMGKSVVLGNLGRILMFKHPQRLVIFVVFSKFISNVKKEEDSLESMLEVLLKTFCTTTFESNLCQLYFKQENLKVDILLDGLDEVNSADSELALKCVKMLDSIPSVRVWVTTRPHHRNNLENTVQQLAFNIQAFNLENQKRFLVRYWITVSESDGVVLDMTRLEKFAKASLDTLMEKKRDADKWAGVPLQCLLVAEVFRKGAVKFSNSNNNEVADIILYISVSTLKDLFDRLVKKKIKLFKERYPEELGELTPEVISQLENSHIVYALQALLADIKFEELHMTPPLPIDVLLKVGLMETSVGGQTPQFIHLTFAEYFVAKFVHQVIQQGIQFPVYLDIFFQTMNYTENETIFNRSNVKPMSFKFPVVLYFLNCFLGPNNSSFPSWFNVNIMKDLLKAAIGGNYLSLFCWFLNHPSAYQEITSEHLFLAIGFGDVNLIKEVIQLFENKDILSLTYGTDEMLSLLHVAAARGDYKVFEYLLKNQGFTEYLDASKTTSNGLIHRCVRDTKKEEDDVIKDRVHILTAILQLNMFILEEVWPVNSKKTPLLCEDVHVDLLRAMISNGANALAQSQRGETVLHTAAKYLSRNEYNQLIHHIPLPTFKTLVHIDDVDEWTPMLVMLKSFEPLESSLKYFIQHDTDVNKREYSGYTCVGLAVLLNRGVECVETLLSLGASGTNIDKNGGNSLHVAAITYNNEEVIQRFCEEYGINSKDSNDDTPLHRACSYKYTQVSTVELLINLGANVNSKNREGNTPLHEAAASEYEKPEIMKILLDKNADHTVTNLKLDTPLLHGLQNEMHLEKIQMLLSKEKQNCEKTATLALHHILTQEHHMKMRKEDYFKLAELCLARGANIKFAKKDEYSNFQLAIERRCFLGIKFLMEKDCGVNIYDIIRRDPNIYKCAKIQLDQVPSLKYHCTCDNNYGHERENCKLTWEELNKYPNLLRILPSESQI